MRILIVDDDKHTCRILKALLQKDPALAARGLEIVLCGDGEKGLQAVVEGGPFGLVISDLLMPRMDGFAFCRELRRHPAGERVPLIVSSAVYKDPITIRKLKVEVGAEFFTKPFQVAEMMAAVRRLLGVGSTAAPPVIGAAVLPGDEGKLSERPLAGLLLDLFEARGSAGLLLQRGEQTARVHLLLGHIIAVEANSRGDALGTLLVRRGILDEERLCAALRVAMEQRKRLGQVLLDQGLLGQAQLLAEMEAQMKQRIARLLRCREGSYKLLGAGPAYERITLQGGTPLLVFSALRDSARPDQIDDRPEALQRRLYPTARARRLHAAFEQVFGPDTLSILERRPLLGEALAGLSGSARDALLCRVEAMLLCGLGSLDAARDGGPAEAAPAEPVGTAAEVLRAPPDDPRHRELLAEYLSIDGRDLYEVLGVPRGAGADLAAIQAAYQTALARVSPERFVDLDLGPDYGKISELRERYRHALGVLSSPVRRAAYDRELELSQSEETSPKALRAELLFREGEALLAAGRLAEAPRPLEEAAAAAPDQADYHALLGWVHFLLAREGGAEPQRAADNARPHLERALQVDADHGAAHGYLGHIAIALAEWEQAAAHFERVLDAEPQRRDALAGLERALSASGQFQRLVLRYRRIIRRLVFQGAGGPGGVLAELYRKLASLCEEKLHDREGAQEAVAGLLQALTSSSA